MPTLTVCGGGNASHVLVALAAHAGWDVNVFASLSDEAERLRAGAEARGGLTVFDDGRTLAGCPRRVSADPAEVIPGADLILLALPAFAHGATLHAVADYLDAGATVGVFPARSGFDYQIREILDVERLSLTYFGLQTLPWACRIKSYGQEAEILGTKAEVDFAVFPQHRAETVIRQLAFIHGVAFKPAGSFLALTLANTGQLIHPGIMYGLCHGKESDTFSADEIPLFYQNVDEHTAAVLQSLSDEVQAVADALVERLPQFDRGHVISLYDWVLRAYPDDIRDKSTLRSAFVTNHAYTGLRLPVRPANGDPARFTVNFAARYLSEDVPYGLIVLRGIAGLAGVPTPALDRVIGWAQERLGRRYLVDGGLCGADLHETRVPQRYGIQNLEQLSSVTWMTT
jgi:hypothetical protein